jgi:class 3 adenylate cyclase/tetratricopeptide (TPR) repeat protein
MRCPRCEYDNLAGAKFCGGCGARLEALCPSCNAANPANHRFCHECGAALRTPAPQPVAPDTYTPRHLAERILTSRAALEGEHKQITVLFADLKDSMELLAGSDSEQARRMLDPVLELMMEAVHRYEGTVSQVMGDGIMALFGAPLALEDHAVRACYAALRMQESVTRHAEATRHTGSVPVRIRVGLNSGDVVVRSIGSDLRMDYSAVGQTTHLAARMEQMATPGTILLTVGTVGLAEGYVQVKALGPRAVKGLDGAVEIFELEGANPIRSRLQAAAARGLTRFVGRDAELAELDDALEEARTGRGQVVAVVGEPGVGKSRLFREFTHSSRTQGWLVLEAVSVSFGKATPWFPVVALLKGYFHLDPRDDVAAIREKVKGKLLSLDRALAPELPALLWLLDAAVDDDIHWNSLDPPQRRRRLLESLERLLLQESRVQPLILVFEDLHWIDGETQALLDLLVDSFRTARALLLFNYRPEYSQRAWSGKPWHRQLRIDPLRAKSADALLDAILGSDPSLVPVRRLLIGRTEGNPFFLEESVRTLVEIGALTGERGSYRLVREPETLHIPPTAQALLATRIDRLTPEDKRLLQTAAVIGRDVPLALLQDVVEQSVEALQAALGRLQTTEFLYESRLFPDVEYTFRHALTQEAAYEGLLHEQRRALHARVVKAIQRVDSARLEEQVERLAHHAMRGEDWTSAVRYCRQSGARAIARSANRHGAAFLEQALGALQRLPETRETLEQGIDIRLELRGALNALDEMVKVHSYLSDAVALAEKLGDQRRQALVAALLPQSLDMIGQHDRAAASARRALEIADRIGDTPAEVVASYMLSQSLWHLGELVPATEALKRCVDLLPDDIGYKPFGMATYPAVVAHAALASRLAELGEFRQAAVHAALTLERAEQMEHAYTRVFAGLSVGAFNARLGRPDAAIPLLERAIDLCRIAEIRRQIVPIASVLCYAYALSGRIGETYALLDQTIEDVGGWGGTAMWLPWLGDAAILADRLVEASQILEQSLAMSTDRHERAIQAYTQRLLGDLALRKDKPDIDTAERFYNDALRLAEELHLRPHVAHCHLGLSRLHRATGQGDRAREHQEHAVAMFTTLDMPLWLERAAKY